MSQTTYLQHIADYELPLTCNIIKNFPASWGPEYRNLFLLGYYELVKDSNPQKRVGALRVYRIDPGNGNCTLAGKLDGIEAIFEVCYGAEDLTLSGTCGKDHVVYAATSNGIIMCIEVAILDNGDISFNVLDSLDTETKSVLVSVRVLDEFLMALGQDGYCHLFSLRRGLSRLLLSWKACSYEPWCCTFLSTCLEQNTFSDENLDFCLYVAVGSDDCELNVWAILFNYKGLDPMLTKAGKLVSALGSQVATIEAEQNDLSSTEEGKDETLSRSHKLDYTQYDIIEQRVKKITNFDAGVTMIYSRPNPKVAKENECPVFDLVVCSYDGTIRILELCMLCIEYIQVKTLLHPLQIGNDHGVWRLDWINNKLCVAATMRNGIAILDNIDISAFGRESEIDTLISPEVIVPTYIEPSNPKENEKLVYESIFKFTGGNKYVLYVSFYDKKLTISKFDY